MKDLASVTGAETSHCFEVGSEAQAAVGPQKPKWPAEKKNDERRTIQTSTPKYFIPSSTFNTGDSQCQDLVAGDKVW
jgi:hypothetical protein